MLVNVISGPTPPAGRPTLRHTAQEIEMNNLPGLRLWVCPEARFQPAGDTEGFRDRRSRIDSIDFGDTGYTLNTAINGKPSMTFSKAAVQGLQFPASTVSRFSFIENAYTIAAVVKRTDLTSALPIFAAAGNVFNLLLRADDYVEVRHGTSGVLSGYTVGYAVADTNPHVILSSWDADGGVAYVEVDGVSWPLTLSNLPAPSIAGVGSFGICATQLVGAGADSSFGDVLIFDRNYSLNDAAGFKARLYDLLRARWGLSF